jgi:diguanylate cyclase (GGDEF)-like protein
VAERAMKRLSSVEMAYFGSRVTLAATLVLLYVTRVILLPAEPGIALMFVFAIVLFTVTTTTFIVFRVGPGCPLRRIMWIALPFDLLTGSALIVCLHPYPDAIFTWMLGMAVFYAIVMTPRESDIVATLVSLAYLAGHFLAKGELIAAGDAVIVILKAGSLVMFVFFLARLVTAQAEREHELVTNRDDIEDLNEQLQQRLAELNAVSEITEVVHSSLDFETIGPRLLEIVVRVVDVSACSLLVLDKDSGETLFSVTTGGVPTANGAGGLSAEDASFACITLLDHPRMMVVFCAPGAEMDQMRSENRMMLQAVASELAVAVENSQLYKLTKHLAVTDELTGLANYRAMQARLETEFDRARRYRRPLSLLMLDADEFKRFNDTHGHICGDRALAELGVLLRRTVRDVDLPARYGGEEFAVILPETDAAGAFVAAEKIREAVSEHSFLSAFGARDAHVTVSIGLASFPVHGEDREELLRQADDALYQAKAHGRDRVRAAIATQREEDAFPPDQGVDHEHVDTEEQSA